MKNSELEILLTAIGKIKLQSTIQRAELSLFVAHAKDAFRRGETLNLALTIVSESTALRPNEGRFVTGDLYLTKPSNFSFSTNVTEWVELIHSTRKSSLRRNVKT